MAIDQPGLAPRNLETEITHDLPEQAYSEGENVQEEAQVPVNTETAETQPEQPVTQVQDQPEQMSEREFNRIQKLANEKAAAEARAQQAEAMLRGLVNAQTAQPRESEEAMLAKQFTSFDAKLGYPTDPKEFFLYSQKNAELQAVRAAQAVTQQSRAQQEMNELLTNHPDVASDPVLRGAIVAYKQDNPQLTYTQAANIVKADIEKRFTQKAVAAQAADTQAKNEAYVETTRGASPSRGSTPPKDPEKMSLKELEATLKESGDWDRF